MFSFDFTAFIYNINNNWNSLLPHGWKEKEELGRFQLACLFLSIEQFFLSWE